MIRSLQISKLYLINCCSASLISLIETTNTAMADADQLNSVQQELNKAIDAYRTGDGDLVKRTEVIGKAKELIRHVMEPSDYTMQLCANVGVHRMPYLG